MAQRTTAMSADTRAPRGLGGDHSDHFRAVLTVIFATILFLPRLLKRETTTAVARILPLAFLLFYGAGTVVLVNTAHNGGRLVHELGIRAGLAPANEANNGTNPGPVTARMRSKNTDRHYSSVF